jgi:hypothetical protein
MSSAERKGISDLTLERYALGELPQPEREELARRLEQDAELRTRLASLKASDVELRAQYARRNLGQQIRARLDVEQRRKPAAGKAPLRRLWPVSAALAAAAVAAVAIIPQLTDPNGAGPAGGPEPSVRVKGLEPRLSLHRKTPADSEALNDGDLAREGDLIRVGYQAAGRRYGVILSIDGRGVVTLHLPQQGANAAELANAPSLLDHSYELDDAPLFERFYFVVSDAPFEIQPILEAARRLAAEGPTQASMRLDLAEQFHQHVVSLSKGEVP